MMIGQSKKPAAPEAEKFPRKVIPCEAGPSDDEKGRAYASLLNSPEFAAHRIIGMSQPKNLADEIDAPGMLAVLRDQAAAANRGDLSQAEAMLMNQAAALQSLFVRLTERGLGQSQMLNLEAFIRLALRAQSQCRATLETLATIKNPPLVYARQANVTSGPQQINNGTAAPSRAREIENEQSKLLDAGTASAAIQSHSSLEALGKVDRAKVGRRQG